MECDEECISYPLNDEMSVLFHEMMTKNIKQYPTREIKRSNFLEIGVVDIHEDSLLSELHHAAFNELKVYELSDQRMVEYEINCKNYSFFFFLTSPSPF